MIARVFKYAFGQARVKVMKATLLSAEEWHFLLNMRTSNDVLRYLSGTAYASVLRRFAGAAPPVEAFSQAVHEDFFAHATWLLRAYPGCGSRPIFDLMLRYDAQNLKTLLRGLWRGRPASATRSLLYPLGSLSRLPIETLLHAGDIFSALNALKPTVFYKAVTRSLSQFKSQRRLFPLEIAVDQVAFAQMRTDIRRLGGLDRRKAHQIIGALTDGVNIAWLVRFRQAYGVSPEESINYLLDGGYYLTVRDIGRMARAEDPRSFAASLPAPFTTLLSRVAQWGQIQALIDRWFMDRLYDAFIGDPFHIGLPLSYLLLKEAEVKALECLFSAMTLGTQPDGFLEKISVPVRGGVRVSG